MNADVFILWMKILYAAPQSVLWLAKTNAAAQKNLLAVAKSIGVDTSRVIFAERVPAYSDHLDRYAVCDLFLDTFPYNAHTTTQDALTAGLPVLTKIGGAFHSRVAASILHSVNCQELICASEAEYLQRAVYYYEQRDLLKNIQRKINLAMKGDRHNPYVRSLEDAYCRVL